jgi:hypothetical protein
MKRRKTKAEERPIFDSIRKPTAPPGQRIGESKPEEKARPSLRKIKHKKKVDPRESNADFQ